MTLPIYYAIMLGLISVPLVLIWLHFNLVQRHPTILKRTPKFWLGFAAVYLVAIAATITRDTHQMAIFMGIGTSVSLLPYLRALRFVREARRNE